MGEFARHLRKRKNEIPIKLDDEGRIFVRTYKKAPNGHYYYDVFNAQGKYIAKIPLEHRPRDWKNSKLVTNDQGILRNFPETAVNLDAFSSSS